VKVLDFGLAKLLDDTEAATTGIHRTELTEVGIPYGTATYAAPEQARGERVDKRADIFSLGVLLFEMLTGTWPFRGKTTIDVRHAVLYDAAQPVEELRSSAIPPRLQQIIDKALAKQPKDRFQNMDDFRHELRQVLHEIDAAAGDYQSVTPEPPRYLPGAKPFSRAVRWLRSITKTDSPTTAPHLVTTSKRGIHETPTIADQEKKSLAILCFRNLSNDPASSFYEFSLADAVITELARVRSLVVRPSSVIARYQGQHRDPREIGEELAVSAVLTAGFIHAGERFPRDRATDRRRVGRVVVERSDRYGSVRHHRPPGHDRAAYRGRFASRA
jgi:serine/threonine-protein kinase